MRLFTVSLASILTAAALCAQQAAPAAMKLFASSADVAALIAKAKAERKDQPMISQPIVRSAPYGANLEYRVAVAPASQHDTDVEMFYVIEGAGTLVTGGKLVEEKRTNANNLSGTAIEGGSVRPVAKGDFVMVPEKTPHWFSKVEGTLVLMSIHLPVK